MFIYFSRISIEGLNKSIVSIRPLSGIADSTVNNSIVHVVGESFVVRSLNSSCGLIIRFGDAGPNNGI